MDPKKVFAPRFLLRKILFILGFQLIILLMIASCKNKKPADENIPNNLLQIWTYDSFNSEWGPGPAVSEVFKEKTGIEINWISHGDAGQMLSRLLLEEENSDADIILGLDQNLAERIINTGFLEEYKPRGYENIFPELVFDPGFALIPMDYSFFSIVYDSEKLPFPPRSLEDLADPGYKENLILIDPRTSSVGLGFFGWVKEVYGSDWKDYWRRLYPSILTITEGWDTAYGLFVNGEAPMVLSYTTSPGFHLEYEGKEQFKAAIFMDGHPLQIEAAAMLKSSRNRENAKKFLDFMVSEDFQNIIPLTNWMYPVIDIQLPESFRVNPKSEKPLRPGAVTEADLNDWAALMTDH